jgi:hypothetical protein
LKCIYTQRTSFSHKEYSEIPNTVLYHKLGIPQIGTQYVLGKKDLLAFVIAFRYLLPKDDFLSFKRELVRQRLIRRKTRESVKHSCLMQWDFRKIGR